MEVNHMTCRTAFIFLACLFLVSVGRGLAISDVDEQQIQSSNINNNSRYTPVALSSLSSFARRFWTTMASMVATDAKHRKSQMLLSSTKQPASNSNYVHSTVLNSERKLPNTADVELVSPIRVIQTSTSTINTSAPSMSTITDNQTNSSVRSNDVHSSDHHVSERLEVPLESASSADDNRRNKIVQDVTASFISITNNKSSPGLVQITTCNDTIISTKEPLTNYQEAEIVAWPQQSPRLPRKMIETKNHVDDAVTSISTIESQSTDIVNEPAATSLKSDERARKIRDEQVADMLTSVETSKNNKSDILSMTQFMESTTSTPFNFTEMASTVASSTTETTELVSSTMVTRNSSETEQVPLFKIFDENIINNETLLASSMYKLSSLLTSSVWTKADDRQQVTTEKPKLDTMEPKVTDQSTSVVSMKLSPSDFDFSSLFSSDQELATTDSTLAEDYSDVAENMAEVDISEPIETNFTSASLLAFNQVLASDTETSHDEDEEQLQEAEVVDEKKVKELNMFGRLVRQPVKNATEEPGECFFNITDQKQLCDWSAKSQTSVQWSFGLGETAFMSGGPTTDSNGETTGGYMFVETSMGMQGSVSEIQRASFESPKMSKTVPHGRCFTFWYSIGGLSADRLRLLQVPEDQFQSTSQLLSRMPTYTVLWERKDSTNGTWMKGEVLYTFGNEHRLIFEGFARSGNEPRRKFQGFLAVDDLAIDSGSCKGFCTFEGVLCDWINDESDDDFDWELSRGSDSHLTGPVRDHGEGPEGGFMMIDTSFPRRPGDVAKLNSPKFQSTVDSGPICFKYWTHMYGNGIGTLRVILMSDDERNTIWEVSGESGNSWHMAQVTVASSTEFQLSLEGVVGKNALGRIAIDDLSFGPGPCPSSPQSALPLRGDCTFESDECAWVNAGSGDQFDWLRTSAGQPLLPGQGPNSGYRPPEPLSDHTTGLSSGFFLTMERGTIPPRSGDQAYIVGPTLQGTGANKCFSFWGYMHERSVDATGPGLGSLRVYLRVGASSILRPVWRLVNYEHPDWFFAQTRISTEDKFQVVIGGTWGSTRQGAIAVDDFTFFDGNCSVIPAEAAVISGECTFDSNMCDWSSAFNKTKERSSWQLATNIRRPSNLDDHTYRASAGYVFFDIFSQQPHMVRLESPEIQVVNSTIDDDDDEDDTSRCLTFWFAPFGSSRNTLLRVIQRDLSSNNDTQVWEVTTAKFQAFRPEWIYGQVALNITFPHKIIFEGSSSNGGFALDDIIFVPGTCHSRPDDI